MVDLNIAKNLLDKIIKGAEPVAKAGAKVGKAAKAAKAAPKVPKPLPPREPIPTPPSISSDSETIARYIMERRARELDPKLTRADERIKPSGAKFFDESPAAYDRTQSIVPQIDFSGRYPKPSDPSNMPLGGRMSPIMQEADAVSTELANRIKGGIGTNSQYFYRTGPMYEGIDSVGVNPQEFMGKFAPAFAGTSPRTPTDRNFLNATMMMYRDARGLPLDRPVLAVDDLNDKGYGMIVGQHPQLTQRLLSGEDAFAGNPKPSSFSLNTLGNLQGETIDTHNIRGTLLSFDALFPGELPRGWFHNDAAYQQYLTEGLSPELLSSKTGVKDSLADQTIGGVTSQVEYGPMADITRRAAIKAGVDPADAQALGWFGMGDATGLASANKTITGLANDRLDITAQMLGMPIDVVARLFGQRKIPLASVAGAAGAGGLLAMSPDEAAAAEIDQYLGGPQR